MLLHPIPNRPRIVAFYFVVATIGLAFVAIASLLLALPLLTTLLAVSPVFVVWMSVAALPIYYARKPYGAWNAGVRVFAKLATGILLKIGFHTIARADSFVHRAVTLNRMAGEEGWRKAPRSAASRPFPSHGELVSPCLCPLDRLFCVRSARYSSPQSYLYVVLR